MPPTPSLGFSFLIVNVFLLICIVCISVCIQMHSGPEDSAGSRDSTGSHGVPGGCESAAVGDVESDLLQELLTAEPSLPHGFSVLG